MAAVAFSGCSCEEAEVFVPGVTYEPGTVLSFGEVSVASEKTLAIKVISNGRAALKISSATFGTATTEQLRRFLIEGKACTGDMECASNLKPGLVDPGVTPGLTSTITVTYRPCPDAWNGNLLKPNYNFDSCPNAPDQVEMQLIDNSRESNHKIVLSGTPALVPDVSIACMQGGGHCGDSTSMLNSPCTFLVFGDVTAGDRACDLTVEIRNSRRNGKPTGELSLERIDLRLKSTEPGMENMLFDGKDNGFTVLDDTGAPVTYPITVPIPAGANVGSKKLIVRFDGSGAGQWVGTMTSSTGARFYHNDPTPSKTPFVTVGISAHGASPTIQVYPPNINFGPVEQGRTKTATLTITNAGSSDLRITDWRMVMDSGMAKFRIDSDKGNPPITVPPYNMNQMKVFVHYTPPAAGQDSDTLRIGSNDIKTNPVEIPVSGGAVPRIRVDPVDTLVFELPSPRPPPPIPPRSKKFRVTNVGYGDLVIQTLNLLGPGGDAASTSIDDFSIDGCTGWPCQVNVTLCPPSNPTCMNSSREFNVTYANNDASELDLAELTIASTDPSNPNYLLTLQAEDNPCFAPSPIITVETPSPRENMEVCANANASAAGGMSGTTLSSFHWEFLFSSSQPTPTLNPPDQARVCFTPTLAGVHILSLNVTNSCGSMGSSPATEVITVTQ
ncbi:MAG: choice-of-anchor D domain-containing protein [Myxococcota bacterium]